MTNSLIKNTTIETVAGTEEVPAQPYVPPTPARTVYENRYVCGWQYPAGYGSVSYIVDDNGEVRQIFTPTVPPAQLATVVATWGCSTVLVPVTYPAEPGQPYVPSYSVPTVNPVTGYNLGWNAGGRSIAMFTANGYVQFQARASVVGVIAGLNIYDGLDAHYSGNTTDYAFFLSHGVARIIQNGVQGAYLGTYSDATVFKIDRTGTTITYYMNGVSVGTVVGASTAPAWLEASLYSGDDEVFNPSLVQVSAPDLTTYDATLDGVLSPLEFFGAQGAFAELNGVLPALTSDMSSGVTIPNYAVGNWQLPPLQMSLNGLTGETATLSGTLLGVRMLAADHPYSELNGTLPPLDGNFWALEGNLNASFQSLGLAGDTLTPETFLLVTMSSAGTMTTTLATDVLVSADMLSEAAGGSTLAANALLDAVMVSLASSGTTLGVPEADSETWVVNLTSRGSTTYDNYSFNSFAQIGERFYGAGPAGIYALDGATDDGAQIDASISFGELDFETALKKTVVYCYLGMSGEGHLYMKLIADGVEYLYRAESFSERLRQHRVKFGKGLRESYLTAELHNVDGNDFEVASVEFHTATLSRRI